MPGSDDFMPKPLGRALSFPGKVVAGRIPDIVVSHKRNDLDRELNENLEKVGRAEREAKEATKDTTIR